MLPKDAPPEVSAAYIACTDKQRALALNLAKGMFKSDAMRAAGYSEGQSRKCHKEVVDHPNVVTLSQWYASQAIKKNEVTVERVVEEMGDIALFDPADIVDDNDKVLPIKQWPVAARRAFAGWDANGMPKFWSKTDSVDRIAKIKGWHAPDKVEVKAVVGVVVVPSKGGTVIDAQSTTTISLPPKG